MLPPFSRLGDMSEPSHFLWATGIEDTFIVEPWPATGRTLDEYELTEHYRRWRDDLRLIAELGVRAARYGIPWHRVNPGKGRWDWRWAEQALDAMLKLNIAPIVDLVHYGTPRWIEGSFLNPDFPQYMAEYAVRLAERFKGRIRWYTPLNEPRITAWYAGRLGWWPPFRRGWRGFAELLLAVCRGIVETAQALRALDPEIVLFYVDATDQYVTGDSALRMEAQHRQRLVFLALDLITGSVTPRHPLWDWLLRQRIGEDALAWFQQRGQALDILGINMYPMFSHKRLIQTATGLRIRMSTIGGVLVEQLVRMYWQRYHCPIVISETAARGSHARRMQWLDESVAACRRLRARGVPVIGYTWWPMFSLVGWAYRQGTRPSHLYIEPMGLWDLDHSLARVHTPVVDAYRDVVARGSEAVGSLRVNQTTGGRQT